MSGYNDPGADGWSPSGRGGIRGPRFTRGGLIGRITAGVLALALVGGSLYAYMKYRQIWDSISKVNVSQDLQGHRPPQDPHALNLLLIGSDSRSGVNGKIGGHEGITGQRSDTVMVLHVSPGDRRAVVLSFPRDSVVPVLSCSKETGGFGGQTAEPGQIEQINATFANGGPGCLWKTIEQTAHIRINDFLELTFDGFERVINNLGGVDICLPEAVDDPMSGLHLSKGAHHVWGREALAFWRTREDLGEGSDLQRIQRDQFLMASLIQGIESKGLLTSPTKMAEVVEIAAHNMATDIKTVTQMLHTAEEIRQIRSKNVQFIEVPTVTYAPNPDWVQWAPSAQHLFSAIEHDTKLPKIKKKPAKKSTTVQLAVATPSHVSVEILNGSGLQNQATEAATDLSNRGFNVLGSGNASNFNYTNSVIEYGSARDLPKVRALEADLSHVETLQVASVPPGTIDLILGSTFSSLKTSSSASGKKTNTATLTKTYGGISGNVNVCRDKSAFAGPDGN
jgi:LCP family protein required for cell wall assembly